MTTDPEGAALALGLGFVAHDAGRRQEAVDHFATADAFQFQHLSEETARAAAHAYVDALWEKDRIEEEHGDVESADWTPVFDAFAERAQLTGAASPYASFSTRAWRHHKTGKDYWTPIAFAQVYELRAALQDDEYPRKRRGGKIGFGPEAARYILGIELHDLRRFEEGLEVMIPYFEYIQGGHNAGPPEKAWDDLTELQENY